MKKINQNQVALSLGITASILYAGCLAIVAIIPVPAMVSFVNALQHSIDVSSITTKSISFSGAAIGIAGWFVIAAASGYIFSRAYNLIGDKFGS